MQTVASLRTTKHQGLNPLRPHGMNRGADKGLIPGDYSGNGTYASRDGEHVGLSDLSNSVNELMQ